MPAALSILFFIVAGAALMGQPPALTVAGSSLVAAFYFASGPDKHRETLFDLLGGLALIAGVVLILSAF